MSRRECECDHIRGAVKAALGDNNLRCAACLDAILESKNDLVRECADLRAKLQAAQSELLSRRAERGG